MFRGRHVAAPPQRQHLDAARGARRHVNIAQPHAVLLHDLEPVGHPQLARPDFQRFGYDRIRIGQVRKQRLLRIHHTHVGWISASRTLAQLL